MTYVWLDDLGRVLEDAGVPVQYIDGWQNRGRPSSSGQFNPTGLLCHHTASPSGASDQSEINVILSGNSEAPGPISQLFIGREYQGVYVIAAGRANHAGSGLAPWMGQGKTDGNACMLGIEVSNSGVGERWPDWQTTLYAQTVAACCAAYGWPIENVLIHHDFAQPYYPSSKCDPAGPWQGQPNLTGGCFDMTWDINIWRNFILNQGSPIPLPPIPGPSGDDVRYGPWLIQATGADGNQGVFATDGNMMQVRQLQNPTALAGYRWTLRSYGAESVYEDELEDNGSLLGVDTINSYGKIIEKF